MKIFWNPEEDEKTFDAKAKIYSECSCADEYLIRAAAAGFKTGPFDVFKWKYLDSRTKGFSTDAACFVIGAAGILAAIGATQFLLSVLCEGKLWALIPGLTCVWFSVSAVSTGTCVRNGIDELRYRYDQKP